MTMPGPFRSFVILAGMRTGSNLLEANLNAVDGITSYGEVFNPHFVGKKNADELFGVTLADRERDPRPLLEKLRSETQGLSGFRFFHDHDVRVLDLVLADPTCAKIILTRNPVDSFVSLEIARETGQWKLTDAKRLKSVKVTFDEASFREHLRVNQEFQLHVLQGLQASGQTGFFLDYEDLASVKVLNGLLAFLGLPEKLGRVDDSLKKQNPEAVEDKLSNPEDLAVAVNRADLFGLARTPVFEPRRPTRLMSVVASSAANLLFYPIESSPDAEIRQWLSGKGPLEHGFDARSLRVWRQDHPGHRSFTVLRHPLLRAYQAFHTQIVSGALDIHRTVLIRAYKARLPAPGQAFPDLEAERRAFLVFLHYARLSVLGQCGQRVDPNWASQTSIVQSFATHFPLDHLVRESELASGLGLLAGDGFSGPANPFESGLSRIYDDQVEKAGSLAYARDYTGFGFGRWKDQAAA